MCNKQKITFSGCVILLEYTTFYLLIIFMVVMSIIEASKKNERISNLVSDAEQGNADVQYNLGLMYRVGAGIPQNYKEAVKWFRKAAEQGNADAQYNLGLMYRVGAGIPQNYKEAVKWFRKAAEQGYAKAQHNLGMMYSEGEGVTHDYVIAYAWVNLAATKNRGHAEDRDIISSKMTKEQIAEGQKLLEAFLEGNFEY